jgi:uncharacterized DUF497 family protein
MEFEWDSGKATSNQRTHGIGFSEASTISGDPFEVTISDPDHSDGEFLFVSTGRSVMRRLLVVSYTERQQNRVRIIRARVATKSERQRYDQHQ